MHMQERNDIGWHSCVATGHSLTGDLILHWPALALAVAGNSMTDRTGAGEQMHMQERMSVALMSCDVDDCKSCKTMTGRSLFHPPQWPGSPS